MSPDELDNELQELENRLERLRSLYDQYFLGIEKIEPSIARKDVDRRIWMLRREQIRNTARRFRLQTLVMRYNTFQQYWQRVCRDIENGTYPRHMLRAERTLGETEGMTIAARKRLGMFRRGAEKRGERDQRRAGPNDGAAENDGGAPSGAPEEAQAAPALEPSATLPRPKLDDIDLDMDFFAALEAPEPLAPAAAARAAPLSPAPRAPAPLAPPIVPSPTVQLAPAERPQRVAPAAQRSAALPPVAPAPTRAGLLSRLGQKATAPMVAPPPPSRVETPVTGEPRRASTPPPATAAGLSRPAADRVAKNPPARRHGTSPEPNAGSSPRASPKPGVTDERIRELHGRLLDAKRQVNDAGKVSVDGLTKSLRAAESRLRQQHGNRRIDFDVVIKDGKAVVKPILR